MRLSKGNPSPKSNTIMYVEEEISCKNIRNRAMEVVNSELIYC